MITTTPWTPTHYPYTDYHYKHFPVTEHTMKVLKVLYPVTKYVMMVFKENYQNKHYLVKEHTTKVMEFKKVFYRYTDLPFTKYMLPLWPMTSQQRTLQPGKQLSSSSL